MAKYAFYDSGGDQGDFELILFLKSRAAIQLQKATMEVDHENYSAEFTLIDDIEFTSPFQDRVLPHNFEISSLNSQGQILAYGCETCNSGNGEIHFLDTSSLTKLYTLEGDSDHKQLGKKIVYVPNTGYSE